jgi:hypothetical protein
MFGLTAVDLARAQFGFTMRGKLWHGEGYH